MGPRCLVCLLLLLAPSLLQAGAWQCRRIPFSSTRNFSVPYTLPSLDAGSPVQNIAVFPDPPTVFVAVRNRILVVDPELHLCSVLVTGPTGSARCEICRLSPAAVDAPGPEDVDNVLLLLDPVEPWLYSCGTARRVPPRRGRPRGRSGGRVAVLSAASPEPLCAVGQRPSPARADASAESCAPGAKLVAGAGAARRGAGRGGFSTADSTAAAGAVGGEHGAGRCARG